MVVQVFSGKIFKFQRFHEKISFSVCGRTFQETKAIIGSPQQSAYSFTPGIKSLPYKMVRISLTLINFEKLSQIFKNTVKARRQSTNSFVFILILNERARLSMTRTLSSNFLAQLKRKHKQIISVLVKQ